jgi:uncharacterized protein YecE (DUF72 family)
MAIRIDISGWRYEGWHGVFYPSGLRQASELAFASRAVDTIEVSGLCYSLQTIDSEQSWHAGMARADIANLFASGLLVSGAKLGLFHWQFPPNFRFDATWLERFLAWLPQTIRDTVKKGDVFCYDQQVEALFDAQRLKRWVTEATTIGARR